MIEALKERIRTLVPAIKAVGGAPDFQSAAESNPKVCPACFVFIADERPEPNKLGDIIVQNVHVTVSVVFVVKNLTDALGVAAGVDLDLLRKAVKAQVYGWQPAPEFDPFERGACHLLAFKDGHLWWLEQYLTSYYDRSVL
ncbi:MAG: hypothetical protein H7Z39_10540 [Burkholderiaceae bacterium]|nr:hypothetical protein [Burkholderiaceae bacterium]